MSAPSDGARADARKRLALSITEGEGNWYTDAELAGVIADAKAEALSQAESDLNREAVDFQTGWGSNEIDQAKLWAIGRCLAWLRHRASAERSGR